MDNDPAVQSLTPKSLKKTATFGYVEAHKKWFNGMWAAGYSNIRGLLKTYSAYTLNNIGTDVLTADIEDELKKFAGLVSTPSKFCQSSFTL